MSEPVPTTPGRDFIRDMVERDRAAGKYGGRVVTRFPPEPNGFPHIGHAKSVCLNFGLALENGGRCHLRFDDTNPETEDQTYVDAIQRDVHWLGFDWGKNLFYASDYFEQLYDFAVELIRMGKAYVDSLNEDEIREYRGTVTEPGRPSPYRDRSVEENLDLFRRMRAGEFPDGAHVLRGKIDMSSPNMKMRDPLFYRIKRAHHYHRGDAWCIYPFYDFAHPLSDAIEGITHSLCTLEFENNREIYDWLVDTLPFPEPPRQTEFARLNLTYTVMSKRKLLELVERKLVAGWDDPRLPTLAGLRRRGFTPAAIRDFCDRIGVAKANSTVDVTLLEHCQREDLNPQVPRVLCVLRPLKLVIENYPEGQIEELDAPLYPHDVPKEGSRKVPFSRVLYIERDDFAEVPPKGFHRLSPGREVRLRYAYLVRCESVVKDPATGEIVEVRCTYDPATRGGSAPDGRKVPGTLHWVSAEHSLQIEVRLYDRLFRVERPDLEEGPFEACLNPHSLEVLASRIEPAALDPALGEQLQFERQGYFFRDPVDSRPDHFVFNRVVQLRDSWALEAKKQAPAAPKPPEPKAPKVKEEKAPESLSAAERELLEQLRPQLLPVVEGVLAAHSSEVERYRAGQTGVLGFLVAQVMKQAGKGGGRPNPKLINAMLTEELSSQ
ncbi:MAG TPA: glutamine--tRNA ligase/YqeY domain fusion protein [Thermoanaerobaculia bacterium]|jgi:glutaminyl-tRNA synthetase|nr:glutamine--tRNA ligase/YqeY domain fusion protein [Thermoanaerobaculia bacterium]